MRVVRWGKSLAVRIPAKIARSLELKEGDQLATRLGAKRKSEILRNRTRELALEKLRSIRRPFPPDFRSNRDEANAR